MLTGNKTAKSATPKAGFCMAVYRKVSHGSHFRVSQAMVERKGADDARAQRMEHTAGHGSFPASQVKSSQVKS